MNYPLSPPLPPSERAIGLTAVVLVHLLAGLGLMSLAQPVLQQVLAQPLRVDLVAATPAPMGPPDLPVEAPRPLPLQRELRPQKPVVLPRPTPVTPPVIQAPATASAQEAPVFTAPPPPAEPVTAVTDGGVAGGASVAPSGGAGGSGSAEQGARYDVDYLSNPKPPYPMVSRRMGEEGTVLLRVQVSEAGRPLQVLVAQSSGYARLDSAARETVASSWRFVPGRRGDQAVTSWAVVPIEYSLSR
jgi:periplasmic protein TonB